MSKSDEIFALPHVAEPSRIPLLSLNACDVNDAPSSRATPPLASDGRSSAWRKLAKSVASEVGSMSPDELGEADGSGVAVGVAVGVGAAVAGVAGVAEGDAVADAA